MLKNSRMRREDKTVTSMIRQYCRGHHQKHGFCRECNDLVEYSRERLSKCPFQEGKTICSKCKVHCYKPAMREKIREVMRFSGPRMMYKHPIMAVTHLVDRRRSQPINKK